MDFGLAHLGGRTKITKTGAVLGTPSYTPPEQLRGEQTDRRTDIWSFSVVLHEMVTGQPPFEGETEETLTKDAKKEILVKQDPVTRPRSSFSYLISPSLTPSLSLNQGLACYLAVVVFGLRRQQDP
jgi:serine/threonine protein kinase